jgi:hypothetical protein
MVFQMQLVYFVSSCVCSGHILQLLCHALTLSYSCCYVCSCSVFKTARLLCHCSCLVCSSAVMSFNTSVLQLLCLTAALLQLLYSNTAILLYYSCRICICFVCSCFVLLLICWQQLFFQKTARYFVTAAPVSAVQLLCLATDVS